MSVVKLLNCLKHDKIKFNSPPSIIFADLRESSDNVMTYNIAAANKFVSEIQRSTDIHVSSLAYISTPKKRKRDEYGEYSPDTRAKLARHSALIVVIQAACYFSSKLGRNFNENTIRTADPVKS